MSAIARGVLAISVGLVAACAGGSPTPAPPPDTPVAAARPIDDAAARRHGDVQGITGRWRLDDPGPAPAPRGSLP
jgi:hypothetical protein